ncbi:hypothetical protein [Campylobacter sp. RM12651]|uniref:hypothetical protein n=1 Tax=Campylobacter sp. RM12651 TaxID=1660079 RepID=UPI001EFB4F81|nr:hypothetical protein [Campylobacter sp. RM12651]ULO03804.1 hypothetical protein AVBRAN_1350 [Campylobacter sp. RM12651]
MKNKDFIDFIINHKNIDKNANLLVCSEKCKGSIFKIAQNYKLKEIQLIYSDNKELIYGVALDEIKYLIKHLKEFKEDYKVVFYYQQSMFSSIENVGQFIELKNIDNDLCILVNNNLLGENK